MCVFRAHEATQAVDKTQGTHTSTSFSLSTAYRGTKQTWQVRHSKKKTVHKPAKDLWYCPTQML